MNYLYTATETFDERKEDDGFSWTKYIAWSGLSHLTELVSLDNLVNESLVKPDFTSGDDYEFAYIDNLIRTDFYTSLDYVSRLRLA